MNSKANVNVYLLLMQYDKLLLSLRQNTGYGDSKWSLVSGHQEVGESATQAMIRETKEEIDIVINENDLQVVHIMHRKTNRENVDIFMRCSIWQGDVKNQESEKCGGLEFYNLNALPSKIVDYVQEAIQMANSKIIYSELGWEHELQTTEKVLAMV